MQITSENSQRYISDPQASRRRGLKWLVSSAIHIYALMTLSGCTPNVQHRSDAMTKCAANESCGNGFLEEHPTYSLGFVEFTERGNDFNPARTHILLEKLKEYAATENIAVVVFVHGWKHNAKPGDDNIASFNKALQKISGERKEKIVGKRRVIGIYVGWRGQTLPVPVLKELTYWDRKIVAEEAGRGGVTDFLLNLEHIDRMQPTNPTNPNRDNYLVIVGHSFGGALTLNALHDQLLDRLVSAEYGNGTKSFGDGVILLNPAIEANQGLILKEISMKLGARHVETPPLLFVVSSTGDIATHRFFPLGQWLGTNLTWSQRDLKHRWLCKDGATTCKEQEAFFTYTFREEILDTTTIGNFAPFHTARLNDPAKASAAAAKSLNESGAVVEQPVDDNAWGKWVYASHCDENGGARTAASVQLPCWPHEPLSFLYTTDSFIRDHNDVFNDQVIALMATVVSQSLFIKKNGAVAYKECAADHKFRFGGCFNRHLACIADDSPACGLGADDPP